MPVVHPRGSAAWIADGWNAVTANFWIFVLMGVVYIVGSSTFPILLQGPLALGLQWAALRQVAGRKADFNDLSLGFQHFPQAVMVCLLTVVIQMAGAVLLIVPALLAGAMLQFPYLLVVDRKLDFWAAIKESFTVSQRHFGALLVLTLLQLGLLLTGLLLCGVGLFVAVPVCYAASAAAYLDLFGLREQTRVALAGHGPGSRV